MQEVEPILKFGQPALIRFHRFGVVPQIPRQVFRQHEQVIGPFRQAGGLPVERCQVLNLRHHLPQDCRGRNGVTDVVALKQRLGADRIGPQPIGIPQHVALGNQPLFVPTSEGGFLDLGDLEAQEVGSLLAVTGVVRK